MDASLRAIVRFFHEFVRKASTRGLAICGRLTMLMNHSMKNFAAVRMGTWRPEHSAHRLR